MESLLASPSQFSPPPSPPDFCSPPLPSLASPFQDSPPPPWMTDDLSQEWVDTTVAGADEESWYATPRADSARTMNYDFGTDDAFGGTFVCREDVKDGLEESQLQAAVRALKGPSSGLGGIEAAEEDATELLAASDASASKQGNPDRLGGLLRLFDPLPPASIAGLPSSVPAPTKQTFDFTPPVVPRTSWKALPHFSPSNALIDLNTPPEHGTLGLGDGDTPTRAREPPGMKAKERYLRSSHVAISATPPAALRPFPTTPAPKPDSLPPTPKSSLGAPELRLFEWQYDTFTKNHLDALFNEIDGLSSGAAPPAVATDTAEAEVDEGRRREDEAWETSFVEVPLPPVEGELGQDEEEDSLSDSTSRSSKRIRLSPEAKQETTPTSSSSSTRSRRLRSSTLERGSIRVPSARARQYTPSTAPILSPLAPRSIELPPPILERGPITPAAGRTRDRLGEANALLEKIRARQTAQELLKSSVSSASSLRSLPSFRTGDEGEAGATPRASRSVSGPGTEGRGVSPRKLLRKLSSSLEVDQEPLPPSGFSGSESDASNSSTRRAERDLGAQASASIRDALSPQKSFTRRMGGGGSPVVDSPSRRQFARTPVPTASGATMFSASTTSLRKTSHTSTSSSTSSTTIKAPCSPSIVTTTFKSGSTLTTIGPDEMGRLNAPGGGRGGGMIFDQINARWIKVPRSPLPAAPGLEEVEEGNSTEDDPFRDISLRESPRHLTGEGHEEEETSGSGLEALSRLAGLGISASGKKAAPHELGFEVEEQEEEPSMVEVEAEEERRTLERVEEEVSADFSHDPVEEVELEMEEDEEEEDYAFGTEEATEELDEVEDEREQSPFELYRAIAGEELVPSSEEEAEDETVKIDHSPILPHAFVSPSSDVNLLSITLSASSSSTPPCSPGATLIIPAVLPGTPRVETRRAVPSPLPSTPRVDAPLAIPRSALKSQSAGATRGMETPDRRTLGPWGKEGRSVSFSDGKLMGKIETLKVPTSMPQMESVREGSGFSPVLREGEEEDTLNLELERDFALEASTSTPNESVEHEDESLETSLIVSSFSLPVPPSSAPRASPTPRKFQRSPSSASTFLTECSFSGAHERLVKLITDVEPFLVSWEELQSLDLSGKGVDSCVRLAELLPKLDEANFANNELHYLTGLPPSLRTLLCANNSLTSLTSFAHLSNLVRLDISHNALESLHQLGQLRHLQELKLEGNAITSIGGGGGLEELDGLVRLSLKGNKIGSIDFSKTRWTRLESLNLSSNALTELHSLSHLQKLIHLNLDHNLLTTLSASSLPQLRVLKASHNQLSSLNVGFAGKLRTLFLDGNRLGRLQGMERLRKLENLSLRDQEGDEGLTIDVASMRDIKRLYLSGNALPLDTLLASPLYSLVYLELALCRLESLPLDLASLIPNVRSLNLNYNFLEGLEGLEGLQRVRKVEMVGNRLEGCRGMREALEGWKEIEIVDFRMNPFTLPLYPPLLLATEGAPHTTHQILHSSSLPPTGTSSTTVSSLPSRGNGVAWPLLEAKYRKSLPDKWYYRRMSYRAALLDAAPGLEELDGIEIGARERRKLGRLGERLREEGI